MVWLLSVLLYALHISCFQAQSISPTIVNATGAYFIANSLSFQDETIECNSSLSDNCYIICGYEKGCDHTTVKCSSNQCIFYCTEQLACQYISIDTSHSNNVQLYCTKLESCYRLEQFIGPKQNINASVNIECNKGSCEYANFIIPSANTTSIICNNTEACEHMTLSVGSHNENQWNSNNLVSLECIGYESCQYADINLTNTQTVSVKCGNTYACANNYELSLINIENSIINCLFSLSCYKAVIVSSNYNSCLHNISSVLLNCTDGCNNLQINTTYGINIFNLECISCQVLSLIVSPFTNHTNIIVNEAAKLYNVAVYVPLKYQRGFLRSTVGNVRNYSFIDIQCINGDSIYYDTKCSQLMRNDIKSGRF